MFKKYCKIRTEYHLYSLSFCVFIVLIFVSLIAPMTAIHAISTARFEQNKMPCLGTMHCDRVSITAIQQTRSEKIKAERIKPEKFKSEKIKAVLTIDTVPTGATDRIVIPVTASLSEGALHVATVAVNYDPKLLRPVRCVENPEKQFSMAFCNIQFDIDGVNPDAIGFTAISIEGVRGNATLVDLTFEVIGKISKNTALGMQTLAFADDVGAAVPVTIRNNEVADIVPNISIFLPIITR